MSRINLHPEQHDKRPLPPADRHFYVRLALSVLLGGAIVIGASTALGAFIDHQDDLNSQISTENNKLDQQLKEVAQLKQEIAALQARQRAVEDLQENRNTTTHLLDELTRQVPEGIFLRYLEQKEGSAIVYGYAQSNERVSEFMRNIDHRSAWLQQASLVEVRTVSNDTNSSMPLNHVFTFALEFTIATTPRKLDANGTVVPSKEDQQPATGRKVSSAGTSSPPADDDDKKGDGDGDDDDKKGNGDGDDDARDDGDGNDGGNDDDDEESDNSSKDKEDAGNKGSDKDNGKAGTDKGDGNRQDGKGAQQDGHDKGNNDGTVKQDNTAGSSDGTAQPSSGRQPAPPAGKAGQPRQDQQPAGKKAPADDTQDPPANGKQDNAGASDASQQEAAPATSDNKPAGTAAAGAKGDTPDPRDGTPATSGDDGADTDAGQP